MNPFAVRDMLVIGVDTGLHSLRSGTERVRATGKVPGMSGVTPPFI